MTLPPITPANQWTCRVCGRVWVVADLARLCEQRDLQSTHRPLANKTS